MEALPKIVRQRLQAGARPGGHPHADLLTAFAEQSLTDREHARVVEHLSRCEDCREVVFLASAQQDPVQVVSKVPARGGWLSWPVLRWGAAVACVVAVGAAVTLHRHPEPQVREQAQARGETSLTALSIAPKEAPQVTRQPGSPLATRTDAAKLRKEVDQDKLEARVASPARPTPRAMSAAPSLPMQFDQSRQINRDESGSVGSTIGGPISSQVAAAPAQRAKAGKDEAREEDYKKQELADASRDADKPSSQNETVEVEASASAMRASNAESKSSYAAPPPATGMTAGAVAGSFAKSEKIKANRISAKSTPHWMLTPSGALQRSWHDENWETVSVAEGVSFQALAAVLAEIWVGGANGILYHSSDAGLHWVQVVPKANGEVLSASVVHIEFKDTETGKLTTATGETWTTSDAGKTWQKN